MIELNIEILSFMSGIKSITFISVGMILTGLGIVSTLIGTLKQGKENDKFQTEISESSNKNIELAEKLAEQTKTSSERLIKQNEESTAKIVQLNDENADLTKKLTQISEERFRELTIPSMNVINIEEVLDLGVNSYFKIAAKNTGNKNCLNTRLLVDRHNSPFAKPGYLRIHSYNKLPKDDIV